MQNRAGEKAKLSVERRLAADSAAYERSLKAMATPWR
jgi:hypothetical protein